MEDSDDDLEYQRVLNESKKTAQLEEKRRLEEQESEDDLQKALRLSREEAEKQKTLHSDQIDFFNPVQEVNPLVQQGNPYQDWQQQQFYIQQQQQQTFMIQQQQQQQNMLLEQQQQQQRVLQQQLEFEKAQHRQREMELFAQARAQQEAQARAQQEAFARAQQEAEAQARANMFAASQMNNSASNPFGNASKNGVSLNLLDHNDTLPDFSGFQNTKLSIFTLFIVLAVITLGRMMSCWKKILYSFVSPIYYSSVPPLILLLLLVLVQTICLRQITKTLLRRLGILLEELLPLCQLIRQIKR